MLGRNLRKAPWRLLSGLDQPQFDFQTALSLFQIKFWLTGYDSTSNAFARATTYFFLQMFQDGLKQNNKKSPSLKMRKLLRDPNYEALFNYALIKRNPTDVLGLNTFDEHVEWCDEHRPFMQAEANFALCRLAFINQKNDNRLFWAEEYFEKYRPKGPNGILGLSKKDEYRGYAQKAAFLASASLVLPELLNFGRESIHMRNEDLPDPIDFQLFCMHVRATSIALECRGNVEMQRWTGLEPQMPDLPAIPCELLEKWSPKTRRSAETTARGNRSRQRPQPKNRVP